MSGPSVDDFKPGSFTLEKYVEKLAQLNPDTGLGPLSKSKSKPFEPTVLLESFEASMQVLQELAEKNQRRVDKLEHVCTKREEDNRNRIKDLEATYEETFTEFQALEERITNVSTKVVHLGDQLESLNNRRVRGVEAQSLMIYLSEFEERAKPPLPVFTDPSRKLEAADLIYKLHTLSLDLPSEKKYTDVKQNITAKYAEIESALVDGFIDSQRSLDTRRMKEYAQALLPFSHGTQRVVDNYIAHNMPKPGNQYSCADEMFSVVGAKCKKAHKEIVEVFDNPDAVMIKLLQSIVGKVLGEYIHQELTGLKLDPGDKERYLVRLHALYEKSMALQKNIPKFGATIEQSFLSKMIRVNLFSKYLSTYTEMELSHFTSRCDHALSEFQDMVGISRRAGSRNMTGVGNPEETYVSQEVCTSILYEAKGSIRRAQTLLGERELSELAQGVYFTSLEKICTDHFHTALDLGLNNMIESKVAMPVGHFCMVVGNINCNMHLVDKLFREVIVPCIHIPSVSTNCVEKKRGVISKLEAKIEAGIEKNLAAMVTQVKNILGAYQKKTEYKPEGTEVAEVTQACGRAVSYISQCCKVVSESLDGKNLESVLLELGIRLHKIIFEHVQAHVVNEMGAMILICDMNEYRRSMKDFKNPFLDELYESLQTLCNIFVVKADNLQQVLSEEPYVNFDRAVLQALVAARSDNKSAKLSKLFT